MLRQAAKLLEGPGTLENWLQIAANATVRVSFPYTFEMSVTELQVEFCVAPVVELKTHQRPNICIFDTIELYSQSETNSGKVVPVFSHFVLGVKDRSGAAGASSSLNRILKTADLKIEV